MACKVFKSGFSLVEVMMFLLIASLIAAASVPIVTKKHFKLPQVVGHGAYLCSYNDDGVTLHETRWTGKYVLKKVLDRDVDECKFVVPDKAPYFQISAIGGGGGGGDAGYTNVEPTSGVSAEQKLGPFNLTEDYLNQHGISKSEFESYAGRLYGYARGGGSGAGGNIGYVDATLNSACMNRTVVETEICLEKASGDSTSCYCKDEDGNKTGSPCSNTSTGTVAGHYEDNYEIDGDPKTCTESDCIEWGKTNCKQIELMKEVCTDVYRDEYYYTYVSINGTSGKTNTPSYGDQNSGTRITGGPIKESVFDHKDCRQVGTGVYEEECDIECTKSEVYVVDCSTYVNNPIWVPASTVTIDNITNTCSACTNGIVCEPTSSSGEPPCLKKGYEQSLECEKDVYGNDIMNYWYTYTHSIAYGLPGGSKIACVSQPISGALELTGNGVSNAYDGSGFKGTGFDLPRDGSPSPAACFNSNRVAEQGKAPCVDSDGNAVPLTVCTEENPASSASYTITNTTGSSVSAVAVSARAGGAGASRGLCTEDDGHSDAVLTVTNTAINASCSSGLAGTPCGSGWNGYCLIHNNGTIEANGAYRWKYTYDNNYLTYGAAGEAGELKTAIVRSLKGVDTTIKLGQGGSPAELNTGGPGVEGTETTFGLNGSIITAHGGKGGAGNLQAPIDTFLPAYDPTKHANGELVKKYYGQAGTQANAVGLASKIMNIIVDNNDGSDATNIFMQKGIGGQGGGVQHNCWAGQRVYYFEGQALTAYSVYPSDIPSSCKTDFANIEAQKGNPGALLIKW